jgi:hypothetical protein
VGFEPTIAVLERAKTVREEINELEDIAGNRQRAGRYRNVASKLHWSGTALLRVQAA